MSELIFNEEDHAYYVGSERMPSVTQVLSVLGGYEGIPAAILAKAAARGTAVHTATELDDAGTLDYGSLDDELIGYVMGWQKFKHEKKPVILDAEVRGYHPVLKFAGTRDRRIQIGNKVGILDIKSSYMLMPTTGPQTAAYIEIYNAGVTKEEKIKHRWGLRLTKDGEYELHEYKEPGDWNTFVSALNVFRYLQKHNPKKLQAIEEYRYDN